MLVLKPYDMDSVCIDLAPGADGGMLMREVLKHGPIVIRVLETGMGYCYIDVQAPDVLRVGQTGPHDLKQPKAP